MSKEILMPQLGLTMEEGEVQNWQVKEGDLVKVGDKLAEIVTDKLTNDLISEVSGTVLKIVAKEGEDIPVQGVLLVIGEEGESVAEYDSSSRKQNIPDKVSDEPTVKISSAEAVARSDGERIKISPLARKIAAKHDLDYSSLEGTGPSGRIIQRDILAALEELGKQESDAIFAPVVEDAKMKPSVTSIELMDGDEVVKRSGMRKVVAERMTEAAQQIPMVTQDIKVDVTELLRFRKELNHDRDNKISVNDLILKAVAKALSKHPEILVSFDGDQVIRRKNINIGMAVSVEDGLLVPVIRNADQKSLERISIEAKDLATRARDNQLDVSEYKGSTFSVSNLGMYGITSFTPIINLPDAAILGVCAAEDVLATVDGEIYTKQVMTLSLTFDHRVIDGAQAAKFQNTLKNIMELPIEILI